MRYFAEDDEWYPVYTLLPAPVDGITRPHDTIELTDEFVAEFENALREFRRFQGKLREIIDFSHQAYAEEQARIAAAEREKAHREKIRAKQETPEFKAKVHRKQKRKAAYRQAFECPDCVAENGHIKSICVRHGGGTISWRAEESA